ncbi:MAG: MarR family transcriptional regulator [Candidatus Angelobacter sp.]|nr:MarR family transcriptional regulator [Candidatus Angelobacter sp.]
MSRRVPVPSKRMRKEDDDRSRVRLWLRLLKCTNLIESNVRGRLRDEYDTTLPRFDMLAQLDAADSESGLTMGELSRRLMVTNGNLTGLTERLVKEKLVSRSASPNDRRTQVVRLTANGKRALQEMAAGHRRWIQSLFAGLDEKEISELYRLIGRLKDSVQSVSKNGVGPAAAEETRK